MSHFDITAAETKSIGFDYQYYYFLLQLLKMRAGQQIGLEVKDDVHIEMPDGKLVLIQLKHTVQTNKNGAIQNLTERDIDLWKTLDNWIKVIQDVTEGRNTKKNQLEFISDTTFALISNKASGTRNQFFTKIDALKAKTIAITDFITYMNELISKTEDTESNKTLRGYMNKLSGLEATFLLLFLSKLEFRLDEDDLIAKIKTEIKGFAIPSERIDDVYASLNSSLRDNIYLNVKSKSKIIYTHDDFLNKYRNCFGRMSKLPIRKIDTVLPDDYNKQPFIQQLIDIGDVHASEKDQIIGYTKLKLLMYNNMKLWLHNGELTGPQKEAFENVCMTHWNNTFRAVHRTNRQAISMGTSAASLENDIVSAANDCLNELRRLLLKIEDEQLDIDISNGQFYQLADELRIGWHIDWENKYKK